VVVRVLILHSRYRSGDVSGENRVVVDEARMLADAGHRVVLRQLEPQVDRARDRIRTAARALWAPDVAAAVRRVVRREHIDVVHAHNLFPTLSPAVLTAARGAGAAVVVTLHNYRLLCLPASLERDGRPCEVCVGRVPWRGVRYRCYRGSLAGSAALAASLTLHRAVGSFAAVHRFLAVSAFVRDRHVGAGFEAERILVKPNFVPPARRRDGPGEHFLFLGRLAPEKGVDVLLAAWRPELGRLLVAGDGPESERLRRDVPPEVEVLGPVPADRAADLIAAARAVLVPSRWPEPAVPRAVLEAYAAGVPVVASAVGALPEGVVHGETGLLVPAGEPGAWTAACRRLLEDAEVRRLGDRAAALWRDRYGPQAGLRALEDAYGAAIEARG
jgi:glycosyltransferase involved in cell wall biosynthesis